MNEPQQTANTIAVDFLYLDLGHCTRCAGTEAVLDKALAAATPALGAMGYDLEMRKIHVTSAEQAKDENFIASPTIRIAGRDIQPEAYLNTCAECGDLCNCAEGIDCRVWEWKGERMLTPPVAMIVGRLMEAARHGPPQPSAQHGSEAIAARTENIERFFASADEKGRCCAPDCCS